MVDCKVFGKVVSIFSKDDGTCNVSVSRGDKHFDNVFSVPNNICQVDDEVSFVVRIRRYFKSEKNYGYFFIYQSGGVVAGD